MNIVLGLAVGTIVAMLTDGNEDKGDKKRSEKRGRTIEKKSGKGINCTYAHSHDGLNYVWLEKEYGVVKNIKFEEPAGSGKWMDYTDEIWKIHCKVISHNPEKLVEEHVKAFVDKKTRFARLLFTFVKDGKEYTMEPDRHFYELERYFFNNNRKF